MALSIPRAARQARAALSFFAAVAVVNGELSARQLDDAARRIHVTPNDVPVRALAARTSFEGLTEKERLYAYWMSEASWRGAPIVSAQVSPESPQIFDFLLRIYAKHPQRLRIDGHRAGITDAEFAALDDYAARFFSNLGNYLEFGDTKFVPAIAPERVARIVEVASRLSQRPDDALQQAFERVRGVIWSLDDRERHLGFPGEGVSGYYGPGVSQADVEFVRRYLESKQIEPWNTRVIYETAGPEKVLKVRIASARRFEQRDVFEDRPILIGYGDHSESLTGVIDALKRVEPHCANDIQREMIRKYIEHFAEGHITLHKDAMRAWVKDLSPAVETNLGFIETYRDPANVRAEWEGLVAVVNREESKLFSKLVEDAPRLIPQLPWPKEFEKDTFERPDFTSLDVLTFANAGIPAGINIPNYDDIRMTLGFKNVSLGNVLAAAGVSQDRVEYIPDADQELYRALRGPAFHVQVALHELLGHGSGKLLTEEADSTFNFDKSTVNPLTGASVATWYKPGQSWNTVFGRISTSYEECRAEAVGLWLGSDPGVLALFGHANDAESVIYVNWLSMARAGIDALTVYDPEKQAFGQAHAQGRYVLMRVMLEAGQGLLVIEPDAQGRFIVTLDRTKIESVGRPAIGKFLTQLGVHKATADFAAGSALYAKYSAVDATMSKLREYALQVKKPRHIWVQPVLDLGQDGKVIFREYPATDRGIIDSFVDRFGGAR
jgi:dipeptidyl-peptidase III